MNPKRPVGLALFSLLAILAGFLYLFLSMLSFPGVPALASSTGGKITLGVLLLGALAGFLLFLGGYGLWKMREWGRFLVLTALGLVILLKVSAFLLVAPIYWPLPQLLGNLVLIAAALLSYWFLSKDSIKDSLD